MRCSASAWPIPFEGYLGHLVDAHQSGADHHSAPPTLLMFEAFLRNVVDGSAAPLRRPRRRCRHGGRMSLRSCTSSIIRCRCTAATPSAAPRRSCASSGACWEDLPPDQPEAGEPQRRRGTRRRLALLSHADAGRQRSKLPGFGELALMRHLEQRHRSPKSAPTSCMRTRRCSTRCRHCASASAWSFRWSTRRAWATQRRPRYDDRRQPALPAHARPRDQGAKAGGACVHDLRRLAQRHRRRCWCPPQGR